MIKALLFDLDDTLLGNDMQVFLPAYIQAAARCFPELEAAQFAAHLLAGTGAMLANTDPTRLLRDVFLEAFPPAHTGQAINVWQRFEAFYRTDFPGLQPLTQRRPAARAGVDWALTAGYRVAVTTSPLFPLAAIQERLRWAGVAELPFGFITHLENSHFTKPHPEYFAEALARLGLRPDEAVLIGNDWRDDLEPAAALGLPHYWIAEPGTPPPAATAQPVGVGRLEDFLAWAPAGLTHLPPPAPPAAGLPAQLAGHLAYLLGELADRPADQWTARAAGGWSLTEVVCHLRDVDREVNAARIETVLANDNPFLAGVDTDPWITERRYQVELGPQALAEFTAARRALIGRLAGLPPAAWRRPARHAFFGPTTLAEILGWTLDHDRLHLEQVRAILRPAEAAPPA